MADHADSNELIQKAETRNQRLEIGRENEDADLKVAATAERK
jgi:hypothetical protein